MVRRTGKWALTADAGRIKNQKRITAPPFYAIWQQRWKGVREAPCREFLPYCPCRALGDRIWTLLGLPVRTIGSTRRNCWPKGHHRPPSLSCWPSLPAASTRISAPNASSLKPPDPSLVPKIVPDTTLPQMLEESINNFSWVGLYDGRVEGSNLFKAEATI